MSKPKLSAQIKIVSEGNPSYSEWVGWSNVGTRYELDSLAHAIQKIMDDPNAENGWMIIDGDNNVAYVSDVNFARDVVRMGVINFNCKIETIKIGLFDVIQNQPAVQNPNAQAIEKLKILTQFMYKSRGTGTTTVQLFGITSRESIFVHRGMVERHYLTGMLGREARLTKFIDITQSPERIKDMLGGRKCPLVIDHGTLLDLVVELFNSHEALEHQVNQLKKENNRANDVDDCIKFA